MNYEKLYKDALERARQFRDENCDGCKMCLESLFPELAESEDERIRRDIISYIQIANQIIPQFQKDNWIAWLEKQGEKKPKWTEEDERGSDETIELLEYFNNYAPEFRRPAIRRSIDWLKSLKQRMEEQQ